MAIGIIGGSGIGCQLHVVAVVDSEHSEGRKTWKRPGCDTKISLFLELIGILSLD